MDRAADYEYMNDSLAWVRVTLVPNFCDASCAPEQGTSDFTLIVPWFGGHVKLSVPCTCI